MIQAFQSFVSSFADVFDEKTEERQVEVRRKRDRELQELKDRWVD